MKPTTVKYHKSLNFRTFEATESLLIFDKYLLKTSAGRKIIKKFPLRYGVRAGEKLKDLKSFSMHAEKILKIISSHNSKKLTVVALGGGSVGDFAGFFASVFKRGVRLIHIPSTWLSAIDSAHGGKTGLNASQAKNQIGTFYSAESVHLAEDLLSSQPAQRVHDASGELLKISLIEGKPLWKKMCKLSQLDEKIFWKLLPQAIKAKYKVVAKDPQEKKGHRQILNLGHTLGHVIESQLKIPHGEAVGQGLVFAIRWSHKKGFLSDKNFQDIENSYLYGVFENNLQVSLSQLTEKKTSRGLLMDKKKSKKDSLVFIFLRAPGNPLRVKVKIAEIIREFHRQRLL